MRRSGGGGQVPQPGQDLGEQAVVAGREPQDQVAAWRQPHAISRHRRWRSCLAAAHAVPVRVLPCVGGELVQPAAMLARQAPHIQAMFTWGIRGGAGAHRACCRGVLHRGAVPYQCSAATALPGWYVQVRRDGAYRPALASSGIGRRAGPVQVRAPDRGRGDLAGPTRGQQPVSAATSPAVLRTRSGAVHVVHRASVFACRQQPPQRRSACAIAACARRGAPPAARVACSRASHPPPPAAGCPGAAQQPGALDAGHRCRHPGRPARSRLGPGGHVRAAHPLPLVAIGHAALLPAVHLHSVVSMSIVTGPSVSAATRARAASVQHPPGHRRQAMLHRLPLRLVIRLASPPSCCTPPLTA